MRDGGCDVAVPCHVRHTKRASAALTLAQPPLQVVRPGVLNRIAQRPNMRRERLARRHACCQCAGLHGAWAPWAHRIRRDAYAHGVCGGGRAGERSAALCHARRNIALLYAVLYGVLYGVVDHAASRAAPAASARGCTRAPAAAQPRATRPYRRASQRQRAAVCRAGRRSEASGEADSRAAPPAQRSAPWGFAAHLED